MRTGSSAAELVRSATVLVSRRATTGAVERLGSGFFVAQGRLLTCAHVVRRHSDLQVEWQGGTYPATVLGLAPAALPTTGAVGFPDAAVLAVTGLGSHPTVALTDTEPPVGARLYIYGFSSVRAGHPEPDSAVVTSAGPVSDDEQFVKLVGGRIADGQSGGPVLDLETGLVGAMVKQTLATTEQREGGIAIPVAAAVGVLATEDLLAANRAEHDDTVEALEREQVTLEPLPRLVVKDIQSPGAAAPLGQALREAGMLAPRPADQDDPRWVGRALFRLTLVQLSGVLRQADLEDQLTRKILWRVGCCVPVDDEPLSWWIPSEAAQAVRAEWQQTAPKIVALASRHPSTGTHLARRALCTRVDPVALPPITAETDPGGLPGGMAEAISRILGRALGYDDEDWDAFRPESVARAREQNLVIVLDHAFLGDVELLSALREAFAPLLFMSSYRDPPVADLPEFVMHVLPAVDRRVEGAAVQVLTRFGL
ncbi:S1 family peptidase [Jatrophihabitans sp. YIM 134969]